MDRYNDNPYDPNPFRWTSMLKRRPHHGEIVDLHMFDPVRGFEYFEYALPTIRLELVRFGEVRGEGTGWQTRDGWLFLQDDCTVWRPSTSSPAPDLLAFFFLNERRYTDRGYMDTWSFAP